MVRSARKNERQFRLEVLAPSVDDLNFRDMFTSHEIQVETQDGWRLMITRYRPVRQAFKQPLFMQPLLLVHGLSQNRHCWSVGEFIKNLLYFGVDLYLLELRGHGKSSVQLQRDLHAREGRALPADIRYTWDVDSYFLYDVPAGVNAVKKLSGHPKIFYCGHSMGGMLGYGYAGIHDDLLGLVTIGSPSNLGKDNFALQLTGQLERLMPAVFSGLKAVNLVRRGAHALQGVPRQAVSKPFREWRLNYLPFDEVLRFCGKAFEFLGDSDNRISRRFPLIYNPQRVVSEKILWLLARGGEREPLKALRQLARWVRNDEFKCYRENIDFHANFKNIRIPLAIIFGDQDRLATLESTRAAYTGVSSEYLLWRPVRGNSHMDLTMGHDIRQICYDMKNLMEYAVLHQHKTPSLPRHALRRKAA